MEDHTFDLEDDVTQHGHGQSSQHDHGGQHGHDDDVNHIVAAEAVLASLREVINGPNPPPSHVQSQLNNDQNQHAGLSASTATVQQNSQTLNNFGQPTSTITEETSSTTPSLPQPNPVIPIIEKGLTSLIEQIASNRNILDELNSPNAIQNLAKNLKALGEGNKKELDIIEDIKERLKATENGNGLISAYLDPEVSPFVLRTEYESMKSRYNALLVSSKSTGGKKEKKGKAVKHQPSENQPTSEPQAEQPRKEAENGQNSQLGGLEGRKKRSIRVEHLIHQMANRRLGVAYPVANFMSNGTRDLPDPTSIPPKAEESVNGVDEFRPDFRADVAAPGVRAFVDQVIEDCVESWQVSLGDDEPEVDRERITAAVNIYWARLCKRYDEQQHRERGELHRDELSRRKQNTYRRQQSLLARRFAAFDSSPLNVCKLRALYRTLLTIDFAAPTTDSPDPKREYTEEEWKAYRKLTCGERASEAHEVIDQFWLSPMARQLLTILDVYSADMNARARKKGRPKQPNPTFHLPFHLWERSTLPLLRPKDASGLPVSGAPGIVLYKFHVDEKVQQENTEWAKGLYDNPPIPDDDSNLPNLSDVMSMGIYASLKPLLKEAKEKANPRILSKEEVEDINNKEISTEEPMELDQSILDPATLSIGVGLGEGTNNNNSDYATLLALNRLTAAANPGGDETPNSSSNTSPVPLPQTPGSTSTSNAINNLANPFSHSTSNPLAGLSGITEHVLGPSFGSSIRARKLGKRSVSEFPGGAATPVPKRIKKDLSSNNLGSPSNSINNTNSIIADEFVQEHNEHELNDINSDILQHHQEQQQQQDEDDEDEDNVVNEEVQGDADFLNAL
ncbi:uncharacterized protein IL334_000792 [Kwoniella shivajii]|uniref:Uncharacterized protein n=1 Tax=Kwoniella shivajii TaxID=564305 RepID=A0ABZ1CUE0_9TREE|nr:hypothetical protein IL334_000792 [Kwoniella shivajii]